MQQEQQDHHANSDTHHAATLYQQYGRLIFAYLYLHTPTREDAEDLTVEVFISAMEHNNLSFISENERLAWLRRTAHNRLIDTYRRNARRPVLVLDDVVETLLDDNSATPEHMFLQQETYASLRQAIARLPHTQQEVLRLRYGSGLRCSEIGILLNKREDAVRKLLSRTINTLRVSFTSEQKGGRYV